jgi:hypothetical protein
MAVNDHIHPATLSHAQPRNTWPDDSSSHVCHHPATPANSTDTQTGRDTPDQQWERARAAAVEVLYAIIEVVHQYSA